METTIMKPKEKINTIRSTDVTSTIFVPAQIENYDDLEEIEHLNGNSNPGFLNNYPFAPILLVLGFIATAAVFLAHNTLQVTVGWLTLSAILVLSIHEGRKNKNIYHRSNSGLGWVAIVVLQFWLILFLLLNALIK